MESRGFYITLPSNSSLDVHSNNTLTKYTVRLPRTLYLKRGFEVALAEIQYPVSWENLSNPSSYGIGIIKLENMEFNNLFLPQTHYQSIPELIQTINKNLSTWFDFHGLNPNTMRLDLDRITDMVTFIGSEGYALTLTNEMKDILGFPHEITLGREKPENQLEPEIHRITAEFKSDIHRGFHSLYVYCNVCEPQIVGDVYAPLLRTVAIKGKRNQHTTIAYNQPHYIPVGTREISEIEIDIRDDSGFKVPFTVGKVVCKLHFRQNEDIYP